MSDIQIEADGVNQPGRKGWEVTQTQDMAQASILILGKANMWLIGLVYFSHFTLFFSFLLLTIVIFPSEAVAAPS